MDLTTFKSRIRDEQPLDLVRALVQREQLPALAHLGAVSYAEFRGIVRTLWPQSSQSYINGSGCWGWSLNPAKFLSPFHPGSDIDLALISEFDFAAAWELLRSYHRRRWYELPHAERDSLMRTGQDIYSGFFTVNRYIPRDVASKLFQHRINCEKLSSLFQNRTVTIRFYRNEDEMHDYCARGIRQARWTLTNRR